MARAGRGGLALGAVDKGDVVPDLSAGDGVLELGVLAVLDAVAGGDLERGACVVEDLGVLGARWHEGAGGLVGAADRRDPDVVGAAVDEDGVAGEGEAGVEGHEEGGLGEHGEGFWVG